MTTKKIKKIISIKNGDNYVADIEDIENRITQNSSNLETAKQELSNKCDTVLRDAKAYTDTKKNEAITSANSYTDQEKVKYLPLIGGTLTGDFALNGCAIRLANDEQELQIVSGTNRESSFGARLGLRAKNNGSEPGSFHLLAHTDTTEKYLAGYPDGRLTWGGKNIVRSVNGALADVNGNVTVISQTIQNTNNFASTFLYNNTGLKIQCIRIPGNQGQQFGTINWLVPFADTNYHVFATSEDPDENLYFQIANVTLAGKTTTSCKVGHKAEDIQQFFTGGFISVVGIGY